MYGLVNPDRTFFSEMSTQKTKIMNTTKKGWTKEELKVYILMLCAKADQVEDKEELNLIKSKTDTATFSKIYDEFCQDNEDRSLVKIQDAIAQHEYSNKELAALKKEIQQVFSSDKTINIKERNLGWILEQHAVLKIEV